MSDVTKSRRPKIYVVLIFDYDSHHLLFASVDIDEAFAFAHRFIEERIRGRLGARKLGIDPRVDGGELRLTELDGENVVREWERSAASNSSIWGMRVRQPEDRGALTNYEHVPGGRRERLIEAAEIIMTIAVEETQR